VGLQVVHAAADTRMVWDPPSGEMTR